MLVCRWQTIGLQMRCNEVPNYNNCDAQEQLASAVHAVEQIPLWHCNAVLTNVVRKRKLANAMQAVLQVPCGQGALAPGVAGGEGLVRELLLLCRLSEATARLRLCQEYTCGCGAAWLPRKQMRCQLCLDAMRAQWVLAGTAGNRPCAPCCPLCVGFSALCESSESTCGRMLMQMLCSLL